MDYRVRVILLRARGESGSRPFSSARHAANNCAGMISGIAVYKSAGPLREAMSTGHIHFRERRGQSPRPREADLDKRPDGF